MLKYASACPEQVESVVLIEALGFYSHPEVSPCVPMLCVLVVMLFLQDELPPLTGLQLKFQAKFDIPDSKTYSTLEAVLDR